MKYPMLNITVDFWPKDSDPTLYILFDEFIYKKSFYQNYMLNQEFCDCNGDIFKVADKRPLTSFWRSIFGFLPGIAQAKTILTSTNRKMSVEELKFFMINRINETGTDEFKSSWIQNLKKAKNHEELMCCEVEIEN